MSLIGDALRKTRQKEAERESERKGVLFSAKIANPPTRSNLGLGLALGALIAVAATVAGGGAVWWLLVRGEAAQPEATGSTPAVTTQTVGSNESANGSLSPLPTRSGAQTQAVSTAGLSPASTANAESTDLGSEQPTARPNVATSETTDFDGGFIGVEDGADVYILEANLGRVRLSLDYIIFRPDDPFAEINGVELHLGGVIEGYRVKAIERDRVNLSNGRNDIVLRTP